MKYLLTSVAVLICLSIQSCKKDRTHRNIICLVDFSVNPQWEERLDYYEDVIATSVIPNMSYEDRLVVLPIDNGSVTNSEELLDFTLKRQFDYIPDGTSPMEEDQVSEENLKKDLEKMSSDLAQSLIKTRTSRADLKKGTDIFGALSGATGYYQQGQHNIVILLSDMMNWSSKLKMEPGSFNSSMIGEKLSEVGSLEGNGAAVIVHTGDITNVSNEHYLTIKDFWTKFFEGNSYQLKDFSSAGRSNLVGAIKEAGSQ